MGVSALALLVGQLAVAQPAPELVVLPPSTEGAKASDGLAAWKVITGQVERAKGRIGISTKVQKRQHDFLVGPAREQARDCAMRVGCLADVGSTLGSDILVAGKIDQTAIVLTVIDVRDRTRIGEVSSGKNLAKKGLKRRARDVAQRLRKLLAKTKKKPDAVATAPAPETTPPPAGGETPPPAKTGDPMGDKLDDPAPSAPLTGTVLIAASQLRGVSRVTIDGADVPFSGAGSLTWSGATGTHRLVATRIDGQSVSRDFQINPSATTEVALEFPAVTPPPTAVASTQVEPAEPVTSKWWFWTSIGAAVVAGSATAVLLIGGEKGGPALPPVNGTVRGTY